MPHLPKRPVCPRELAHVRHRQHRYDRPAGARAHPIDAALIRRLHDGWARFFADPAKHRWTRAPGSQSGYFPFRSENAKGVAVKDLKEFFHVYPDTALPPGVADDTREIYRQLSDLGTTLLGWIQEELPAGIRDRLSEPLPAMV